MPYQAPTLADAKTLGSEDAYQKLCHFIKEKSKHLDRRLQTFRSEKLPEYVRLYKARPKNESVEWPWPGAANLVIPIIGTYSDELLARIMGGIWMYDPLWASTVSGEIPTKDSEELKQVVQNFLMDMAYDPNELDLYRVEQSAFHSAIKYGTGVTYTPWEYQKQVVREYKSGGESGNSPVVSVNTEYVKFDGPKPVLIPLNRFIFDPSEPKLEDMKFMGHIEKLDLWQMQDLPSKNPYYKQDDITFLLNRPDAMQDTEMERELQDPKGIDNSGVDDGAARWYIHKLWFSFTLSGTEYCFEASYHFKTEKVLWICFNRYPKNMLPYQDCKLAYDDESYLGTGFAEMLRIAQTEISNNNNWRTNNRNFNMLGLFRFDPESKLGSLLDVFPGAGIPAKKDEFEYVKAGADLGYSDGPDQFHMAVAKERAGVDPAMGGTGGGIVNQKRGIYSASGTSMVMAQQNNRNNLRTADMRSAHVKMGLKFLTMYSTFGIGEKLKKYGNNADKLKKALEMYKEGTLGLKLRPASASMNKELERQNDILLSDRLERFYAAQAQIIQAISTPNIPPPLKQYYMETLIGARTLMMNLVRVFNKDNSDTIVPDVGAIIENAQKQEQAPNGNQPIRGSNPVSPVPSGLVGQGGVPTSQAVPM